MIEIDLKEIKKITGKPLSKYFAYGNKYNWCDITFDSIEIKAKYEDIPLFDIGSRPNEGIHVTRCGDINAERVCFGKFTRFYNRIIGGRIVFNSCLSRKMRDNITNNHCFFNEDQIKFWIDSAKEETGLDFYYRISDYEPDSDYILLSFDFKNLTDKQIKYILFWERYLFEYPANLCALDAMLLKRDYFPEESLSNLLTLTADAQFFNCFTVCPSQCLTTNGKFLKIDTLKSKLASKDSSYVRDIYPYFDIPRETRAITFSQGNFKEKGLFYASDWLDYEDRFSYYTELYRILKASEI